MVGAAVGVVVLAVAARGRWRRGRRGDLIVFTIDLERPRLLVTVNRTYLAPAWRKMWESVMPVPSAVLAPPGPSGPSSCQR